MGHKWKNVAMGDTLALLLPKTSSPTRKQRAGETRGLLQRNALLCQAPPPASWKGQHTCPCGPWKLLCWEHRGWCPPCREGPRSSSSSQAGRGPHHSVRGDAGRPSSSPPSGCSQRDPPSLTPPALPLCWLWTSSPSRGLAHSPPREASHPACPVTAGGVEEGRKRPPLPPTSLSLSFMASMSWSRWLDKASR